MLRTRIAALSAATIVAALGLSGCSTPEKPPATPTLETTAALPVTRGGRQGIGALVVLDEAVRQRGYMQDKKAQEFAWRRALLPWLEPVAVPRYWRIVDEMPVNSMNKRVYAQLEELFHENS